MHDSAAPGVLDHFREIADRYDVVLCDVWGVVHNGVAAWPEACVALRRFRDGGGRVALITNAPRPAASVIEQLRHMNVPDGIRDAIATSGDLTRGIVAAHGGSGVFHLGPERDRGLFEGVVETFARAEDAALIVNTGLFDDDTETPDDYAAMLQEFAGRAVPMVCANPDIVVERGDRLVYCAGAIAQSYEAMGGEVVWAGKPHRPIYEAALEGAGLSIDTVPPGRVLAIGDSVRTDIAGAAALGFDTLFVASGIHAAETVREGALDPGGVARVLGGAGHRPTAVTHRLVW